VALLSFRFLDRLANVAGLIQNLRIANGDRVDVALGKLQGQVDRLGAGVLTVMDESDTSIAADVYGALPTSTTKRMAASIFTRVSSSRYRISVPTPTLFLVSASAEFSRLDNSTANNHLLKVATYRGGSEQIDNLQLTSCARGEGSRSTAVLPTTVFELMDNDEIQLQFFHNTRTSGLIPAATAITVTNTRLNVMALGPAF